MSIENPTYLSPNQLTLEPRFRHRKDTQCDAHLATLRRTLRNTKRLDPILVWKEQDKEGKATGRLVVLDGHFRVQAYRTEFSLGHIDGRGIPARVFEGTLIEAQLAALSANVRDALPLSASERADAAWALVRQHRNDISKSRLAKASGVSPRTIANMRQKLRQFLEAGEAPSGEWWRDRQWPKRTEDYEQPSDEERQAQIEAISKGFQGVLRVNRTKDPAIMAEALHRALGPRDLYGVVDYLGLVDDPYDEIAEGAWEGDPEEELDLADL